jgi:hypothetical protein
MKYIVLQVIHNAHVKEVPFIFPDYMIHEDVAIRMSVALQAMWPGAAVKPISGGELSSLDINANCHGSSSTLGVRSRGAEDSRLFSTFDYTSGHR